jgi:ATP/maltotriose-dependent transcriptional regulator MalT
MKKLTAERSALIERMKELRCLYDISRLFSHHSLGLERLLREIIRVIPRAWQYPELTNVRLSYGGREYRSKNYSPNGTRMAQAIEVRRRPRGFVEVSYLKAGPGPAGAEFLEEEKRLLKAIAELLGSIVEKKETEMSLRRTSRELRAQAAELQNKNIALKEIISQVELERKALQDQMRMNIELTVLPLLTKLESPDIPPEALRTYLHVVRQNLQDVTSSFSSRVSDERVRLSPREVEICDMIRNGLSNKQIAELMRISLLTVERHRHNIRKKLGIDNEKVNLASFLRFELG